jgi:hypothetical protein
MEPPTEKPPQPEETQPEPPFTEKKPQPEETQKKNAKKENEPHTGIHSGADSSTDTTGSNTDGKKAEKMKKKAEKMKKKELFYMDDPLLPVALANFESFKEMPPGTATAMMVFGSPAGLNGWANYQPASAEQQTEADKKDKADREKDENACTEATAPDDFTPWRVAVLAELVVPKVSRA